MAINAKSQKKESAAPVIELPQAKIKVLEAELHPEPYQVTSGKGVTFTIDPNLNCLLQIEDDLSEGEFDGVKFYDSFKLKQDESGEWTIRDGTKLGALARAYYGNDFFETDQAFEESDVEDFTFMARVEPKENRNGDVTGSMLNWQTIMAVPRPKGRKKVEEGPEHPHEPGDELPDFTDEQAPF